jgi:hypothetical protein
LGVSLDVINLLLFVWTKMRCYTNIYKIATLVINIKSIKQEELHIVCSFRVGCRSFTLYGQMFYKKR